MNKIKLWFIKNKQDVSNLSVAYLTNIIGIFYYVRLAV